NELVAEVRGGVGMMAAVELTPEVCQQPRVTAELALGARGGSLHLPRRRACAPRARGARAAGVFIRPGGTCVAVSPPLTARVEHFEMIAQGIEYGLKRIAKSRSWRRSAAGAIRRAA